MSLGPAPTLQAQNIHPYIAPLNLHRPPFPRAHQRQLNNPQHGTRILRPHRHIPIPLQGPAKSLIERHICSGLNGGEGPANRLVALDRRERAVELVILDAKASVTGA